MAFEESEQKHKLGLLIVLAVFAVVCWLSFLFQKPIEVNDGFAWDGRYYGAMATQFQQGSLPIKSPAPFVYRLGIPFLVSLLKGPNLLLDFLTVNIFFNLLAVLLLYVWCSKHLKSAGACIAVCCLFVLQWHGPVRFSFFKPALCDSATYVLLLAGLLVNEKMNFANKKQFHNAALFGVICAIGLFFREIILVLIPVLIARYVQQRLQCEESLPKENKYLLLIPFVLCIAPCIVLFWLSEPLQRVADFSLDGNYSFLKSGLHWLKNVKPDIYVHAWFVSYGPILAVGIVFVSTFTKAIVRRWDFLVYFFSFFVLSWIGGATTERYLFWLMPLVYIAIAKIFESERYLLKLNLLTATLVVFQLLAQRTFFVLPIDYEARVSTQGLIFSALGSNSNLDDAYAFFSTSWYHYGAFVQYVAFTFFVFALTRYYKMR